MGGLARLRTVVDYTVVVGKTVSIAQVSDLKAGLAQSVSRNLRSPGDARAIAHLEGRTRRADAAQVVVGLIKYITQRTLAHYSVVYPLLVLVPDRYGRRHDLSSGYLAHNPHEVVSGPPVNIRVELLQQFATSSRQPLDIHYVELLVGDGAEQLLLTLGALDVAVIAIADELQSLLAVQMLIAGLEVNVVIVGIFVHSFLDFDLNAPQLIHRLHKGVKTDLNVVVDAHAQELLHSLLGEFNPAVGVSAIDLVAAVPGYLDPGIPGD